MGGLSILLFIIRLDSTTLIYRYPKRIPTILLLNGDKLTLYLNEFKNVRSMAAQAIEYDDKLIISYLDQLEMIFGKKPTHFLWQAVKDEIKLFSSRTTYSHHITNIVKKYSGGKHISNNTIRKFGKRN